jgi:hypothetical protein
MWIHTASLNLRRISYAVVALSCLGMSACGSSDDKDSGGGAVEKEPATSLTDNTAGKACESEQDCGTGTCKQELTTAGFLGPSSEPAPGGYCSFSCNVSADCGKGGVCIGANASAGLGFGNTSGPTSGASGQCLARCDSGSQCREGYRCLDSNGRALESGNAEAAANASGACQVAAETDTVAAGAVGNACTADEECSGGFCMASSQLTTFPGGYCSGRCLADADCGGEGAECSEGFGGAGTCYKTCEADADCGREGYRCRTNAFGQGGAKRCLPGADPLPDGQVGKECAADADCSGAAMSCILMNGDRALPGGYCSGSCVENVDCGATGVCIGGFGGAATGYCYQACSAVGDCREGYACTTAGFGGGMMSPTVCTLPMQDPAADADAGTP